MQRTIIRIVTFSNSLISRRQFNTHPLFKHEQLTTNVWRIEEKYFDSWNLANMYFFKGSEKDLLIDTGVGIHDLPSFLIWSKLRESATKPFLVALTHSHFDHSGGIHLFEKVQCGKASHNIFKGATDISYI